MVAELRKSYQFDLEIIKKPEVHKLNRAFLPKFPAMEIDDTLFFEDSVTTGEELDKELARRNCQRA